MADTVEVISPVSSTVEVTGAGSTVTELDSGSHTVEIVEATSSTTVEVHGLGTTLVEVVDSVGPPGPQGPQGPEGPQGPAGVGGVTYIHHQDIASAEWIIDHNFDQYPSVAVVDSAGETVIAEVTYPSSTRVVIRFSAANGGRAYLNV